MCDYSTFFITEFAQFFRHLDAYNQNILVAILARCNSCPYPFFAHVLKNTIDEHARYSLCYSFQGGLSNAKSDTFGNGDEMVLSSFLEMDILDKTNRLWLWFQCHNYFEPINRGSAQLSTKTEQERNLLAVIQIK